KKYIIIIFLTLSFNSTASTGLHLNAKEDMIIDPGMYWAILARNELQDLKKKSNKSKRKKFMQKLRLSASYGFKPAMQAISAIYQNGDYGFEKDLTLAYSWLVMAHGKTNKTNNSQFFYLKEKLSEEDLKQSNLIVEELNVLFGREATFQKFRRWYADTTTTLGTKLAPGVNTFLNVSLFTKSGKRITAFEINSQLKQMYYQHQSEYYNIIQNEIVPVDN
ncbi:MAG: hypothetical protein AB8B80_16985, partial [Marinicellaceae bacterium]